MARDNHAELQKLINAVRGLGRVDELAAPRVADVVESEIRLAVSQGTDPYGSAWKARKSDGGRPLVHGDKTLTSQSLGSLVILTIEAEDARHSLGWARGGVVREIMPTHGLSNRMVEGCLREIGAAYLEAMAEGARDG